MTKKEWDKLAKRLNITTIKWNPNINRVTIHVDSRSSFTCDPENIVGLTKTERGSPVIVHNFQGDKTQGFPLSSMDGGLKKRVQDLKILSEYNNKNNVWKRKRDD